jgi:heat shock protein HslJ
MRRLALVLVPLLLAACTGRAQPAALAGTGWELVELREAGRVTRVEEPARYAMAFGANDEVALRLDCNRGRARAMVTPHLTGGLVEFGAIATTRMMCAPDSLDGQVARGLSGTLLYTLQGDTLQLNGPGGSQLVWRRASVTPPG